MKQESNNQNQTAQLIKHNSKLRLKSLEGSGLEPFSTFFEDPLSELRFWSGRAYPQYFMTEKEESSGPT